MKTIETSPGTRLHMQHSGDKVQTLVTTNVDQHLKAAKRNRDLSPSKLTYAAQDNQVMGTIPPVAIMELMKKGYDLLAPIVSDDTWNAALRWLEDNPCFKSTNKRLI